jgi:hypothetical protein
MNSKTEITHMQNNNGFLEEHLCYILSQGFHLGDKQSYLALIAVPNFRCNHCGKQASRKRNLCVPMEL